MDRYRLVPHPSLYGGVEGVHYWVDGDVSGCSDLSQFSGPFGLYKQVGAPTAGEIDLWYRLSFEDEAPVWIPHYNAPHQLFSLQREITEVTEEEARILTEVALRCRAALP